MSKRSGVVVLLAALGCSTQVSSLDGASGDSASPAETGSVDSGAVPTDRGAIAPGDAAAVVDAPGLISINVVYEDRPFSPDGLASPVPLPARRVRVQVLDGSTVVAGGFTDVLGHFSAPSTLTNGTQLTVKVSAEVEFEGHRVRTSDRSNNETYVLEGSVSVGTTAQLVADAAQLGGAFNIVDTALKAIEVYRPFVATPGPMLSFRWQQGQPYDCGSCYGRNVISLGAGASDTDEYDDDIILHELGHYFVEHYSADSSPAGSHRDRQVVPTLAYGEGVAYFFTGLIQDTPIVIDTFISSARVIDNEAVTQNGVARPDLTGTTDGTNQGRMREEVVSSILWDAYDAASASEPFDRVALGREGMLHLLVDYFGGGTRADRGATGIDLTDALQALVCFSEVPAADVVALAEARAFPFTPAPCP